MVVNLLFSPEMKRKNPFLVFFSLKDEHNYNDCTRNYDVGVNYNTQDENNKSWH